MLPKLPARMKEILAAIQRAGGQGYVVGGALRDLLLGGEPTDWDLSTTLSQPQLLSAFPGAKNIGGRFGTLRLMLDIGTCDITPCRGEEGYTDKRHPDKVWFTQNILGDLSRRDFTVNAMAYDGNILLDPFGGQRHLRHRLLCCVGSPMDRFNEDPLRILRLFRFSATLGFTAEWNTFIAAANAASMISALPRERVREEMHKIVMSDLPQVLGSLITRGGLVDYGFSFAPSLVPLAEVPKQEACRWWALIALTGANPDAVGRDFGLSRRLMSEIKECTRLYLLGPADDKLSMKQKICDTKLDYAPVAVTFSAVSPSFMAEPVIYANILANKEPYRVEHLAVNGSMLLQEGIEGPACGRVLRELRMAVIKNPALNREAVLMGLARALYQTFQ